MKKLLLFIFIISLSNALFAQAYVPFPTERVIWHDFFITRNASLNKSQCKSTDIYSVKDTIIDSTVYYELFIDQAMSHGTDFDCWINTTYYNGVLGYFRNDSLNRKVWLRLPGSKKDTLFYDFDLGIGDTLEETYVFPDSNILTPIVQSIDTVNYGGIDRKRFHIKSISYRDTFRIIEGIGGEHGFLDPFESEFSGFAIRDLICMATKGKTIYPDSSTLCNLITGINKTPNQIGLSTIGLYPNPVHEQLNISIEQGRSIQYIRLYDLTGREQNVEIEQQGNGRYNLNLGLILRGIYIVNIILEDGVQISEKVLKN